MFWKAWPMTIWHRPHHGEIPNSLLDLELPLEPPQRVVWSIRTGYVPRPSITTVTAASRPPSWGPSWAKQHGICIPWLQWISWVWVSVPRHLISRISREQPQEKWFGQTCFTTKRQSQRVHPLHQPDLRLQPRQVLPRRSWDLQVTRSPTKNRLGMQEISSRHFNRS